MKVRKRGNKGSKRKKTGRRQKSRKQEKQAQNINESPLYVPQSEPKMSQAYLNPTSNKKSKGQNYLEFQLHVNVSCIL